MNSKLITKIGTRLLSVTIVGLIFHSVSAQIPTLTTDDIIVIQPLEKMKPEALASKSPEKIETGVKTDKSVKKKTSNPMEDAWNEKHSKILELTKRLRHDADQADLEIIKLRNQMQSANGKQPGEFNNLNQQISALSEKSKRLKGEASAAENELSEIRKEGKEQDFKLKEQSFKDEKGQPDQGALEKATLQIQQEIQNEEAHIELIKLELNRLRSESLGKNNADQFARNRIDTNRSQAEAEIQNSIKKIEELKKKQAQNKIDAGSNPPK